MWAKHDFDKMRQVLFEKCKFIQLSAPLMLDSDNLNEKEAKDVDKLEIVKSLLVFVDEITCDPEEYASRSTGD